MKKTNKLCCNKCGHVFQEKNGILVEDFIEVNKRWGYFSGKDGKTYSFVLCEKCSDSLFEDFLYPVSVSDTKELL